MHSLPGANLAPPYHRIENLAALVAQLVASRAKSQWYAECKASAQGRVSQTEEENMEALSTSFAAALAIAVTAIATAWAQSRIGSAAAASMAEKPELSTTAIILVAIPETMVILGFVVAAMILGGGG